MNVIDIFLDEVDSTQSWAKQNYLSFDKENITCITANKQTDGIGRYNRKWISPEDTCLASTFYFSVKDSPSNLRSLALITCLSLATVLMNIELSPKIKWPNDIMINDKKLSGVLCQTIIEKGTVHLFLGVGININLDGKEAKGIDQPATSLLIETGKTWDKYKFLKLFQTQFLKDLSTFSESGFSPFYKKFNDLLLYKDKEISVFDGIDTYTGTIDSISSNGELNLKLQDGSIKIFQSGDIIK